MKGLPVELLFILFFAAMVLYNYIRQRAAGRRPPEPGQVEPEPVDIPESGWGRGSQDPTTWTEPAAPVQVPPPRRRSAAADTAAPADRRRRFDRQTLLGSRRRVQDAFVVATILGRCRADEPHEER